jgi:hypothetical protein
MISIVQSVSCGYLPQTINYRTLKSPFKVSIQSATNATEAPVAGVEAVYVYHTVGEDTQVGIDVIKGLSFIPVGRGSLDGYTMCIASSRESNYECIFDEKNTVRISTYDVLDHSCDSGAPVQL